MRAVSLYFGYFCKFRQIVLVYAWHIEETEFTLNAENWLFEKVGVFYKPMLKVWLRPNRLAIFDTTNNRCNANDC